MLHHHVQVNKYLMSTDGFHYPMALSCLGMFFSSIASWLACRVRSSAHQLPEEMLTVLLH